MVKPLRVASYNIHKAVGLDGRRRPGRVLDVINQTDADVVVLQEADRRLGERPAALQHRLIEDGSDYDVVPLAENEVSLGWHGNAILIRRGLALRGIERLALPGLEPRGAVLADISTPDGTAVSIVGVHLALLRPWRRLQIEKIAATIAERPGTSNVVAGDFNEWSAMKGLEALSPSHCILSPGKSFHASRPLAALDRIAFGGGLDAIDAGVDESPKARISSDHLPIWADLRLPNPSRGEEYRRLGDPIPGQNPEE